MFNTTLPSIVLFPRFHSHFFVLFLQDKTATLKWLSKGEYDLGAIFLVPKINIGLSRTLAHKISGHSLFLYS